jgi:hypothetical protein
VASQYPTAAESSNTVAAPGEHVRSFIPGTVAVWWAAAASGMSRHGVFEGGGRTEAAGALSVLCAALPPCVGVWGGGGAMCLGHWQLPVDIQARQAGFVISCCERRSWHVLAKTKPWFCLWPLCVVCLCLQVCRCRTCPEQQQHTGLKQQLLAWQ